MSITSLAFVLFIFAVQLVYWIVPKRFQWCVLLVSSCVFYLSGGVKSALYVLLTASTIYGAALWMQRIGDRQRAWLKENKQTLTKEEKAQHKKKTGRRRRAVMIAALLLNLGVLCVFKYFHFALEQFNAISRLFGADGIRDTVRFIVPLGISFYTFQSIGYLVDVYWEHYEPEKNYFKVLLFVSFFPQMTQGPISSFDGLSKELFAQHTFSYKNYTYGMQRMLWGFAKKLLVANILGAYVSNLFANFQTYTGITTLLGAVCYSIQIYADFSGYMDIMCGLCEAMGITLRENFDRPYFSKSIAEYWRRWHISLGDWFKKYIYYPIGMTGRSRKLAKNLKVRFSPHFANSFPATIALLVVWSATGLWHGASWGYIVWGLLNGAFIIFSMWMEPVFKKCKTKLGIRDSSRAFRCFQILRTFVLVTFIKVLPEVGGLRRGLALWKHILTDHRIPQNFAQLTEFVTNERFWLVLAMAGAVLMLAVSLLQRKGPVRDRFNKLPMAVRLVIEAVCVVFIFVFGGVALTTFGGRGFMYAGF